MAHYVSHMNEVYSGASDILVAGAGVVGLAVGLALAQAGRGVVVAGPAITRRTGQMIALMEGSFGFLSRLGLGGAIAQISAPLAVIAQAASLQRRNQLNRSAFI